MTKLLLLSNRFRLVCLGNILLIALFSPALLTAQNLLEGCDKAKFGVDADTRSNISLFGDAASPLTATDDWFDNGNDPGIGIIDTTNSWQLTNALQNASNIEWFGVMAYPKNSIMNNVRLHDASYAKDFYGGSQATDYTSFTQASKNGEDPAIWDDGPHNVLGKNDLIDCYAHLRRDGVNINDELWMYLGFSRIATSGDSYFDAEMYVEEMSYDPVNGFPSGGPDEGHTAWGFDAVGNIIKVGDLVATCNFSTNNAPVLSLRVWVSRYDFQNTDPATFDWGGEFDGGSNFSSYGYADIQIPMTNSYGCGLGNQDYAQGPPWGTLSSSGNYSLFYEANQFVEVGLSLTEFGVDPVFLSEALNGNICELPFSNILFKSRSSSSFTSQLKDFAGPYPFNYSSEVPVNISGIDTIDCYKDIIDLYVMDTISGSFYTWYTEDGNIISNPDSFLISINEAGTYIVEGSFVEGCEGSRDTFVVTDNIVFPPDAEISFETTYGCGIATHMIAYPSGYVYSWTGPNSYTSDQQDIYVIDEGMYYLEVINMASGCSANDSIYVLGYPCQDNIPDSIATTEMLDTIPPDFTVPVDVVLSCDADPLDLTLTGDVTDESDDCGLQVDEAIFLDVVSENYPCAGSTLIQRHWSVIDICGNVTTHIQLITLEDTEAPIFTTPPAITINCEDDIDDLLLTGGVTNAIDNCDTTTLAVTYSDVADTNVPCQGSKLVNRTWTVSDDCGNSSTGIQIITLIDTVPPVFSAPADITIECDADPNNLSVVGDVINETDNCDANIGQASYTDVIDAGNPCIGASIITRTWTLTDDCGNSSTDVQIITLEDTTPPVLILVDAASPAVECDTIIPLPDIGVELIVTDNCDPNIAITFSEAIIESECPDKYIFRRVWIATDACNNQDSIIQEYQVQDTENPIVLVLPDDVTLECDETIPNGNAVVEDNCSDEVDISFVENTTPGSCANNYLIERTWTWMDNCGNSESHTQVITIEDTTAPDFTVPQDVTIDCDDDPNDLTLTGEVTDENDNCDTGLDATYSDEVIAGFPCDGSSLIIRTWQLVDACGNETIAIQEITIIDTTAPEFSIPEDVTIECTQDPNNLTVTGDVNDESDNCTVNIAQATYQDSLSTENACFGTGLIYRVWTLVDGCGNSNSQTQLITVVDNSAPQMDTPPDVTLACTDDPSDLNLTGEITNITDNCSSGVLNNFYIDSIVVSGSCDQNYTIYRNWNLEDACENDTSYLQVITIQDVLPPVFTAPADITLECGDDPNDLNTTGEVAYATDNCDNNVAEAVYTDNIINNDPCPNGQIIERTWIATDACGNSSTAIQHITIVDTTAPLFDLPPDVTIDCNADPTDLTITGEVTNESDVCDNNIGEATYTDVISVNGVCTGSSVIERTWSLTDACGNTTTAIQMILLEDSTPPVFSTPADLTLECDQDPFDLSVTGDVLDESDDCTSNIGEAFYSDSIQIDSSVCLQQVIILRTWVLVDGCGNDTSALQTIIIQDSSPPAFDAPESITVDCGTDFSDLSIIGEPLTVTDNCTNNTITPTYTDSLVLGQPCAGATTVYRTWSATDDCGNVMTDLQQIILQDTFPPTFLSVPADTTVNCNEIPIADELLTTTDSCGGTVDVVYEEVNQAGACADTHYLIRSWTATDACGNVTTATQQITVVECGPEVEILSAQDANVCELQPVQFEVQITGVYDTPVYQWQYNNGSSVGWNDIDGAVSSTLTLAAATTNDIGMYRCLVANDIGDISDTVCSVESAEMALMVMALSPLVEIDTAICEGQFVLMGGVQYTETGTYLDTLVATNGCDSALQLNLVVHPVYSIDLSESICDGETYEVGDSVYITTGVYTTTLTTIHGCDSIVTLDLLVHPIYALSESGEICDDETYEVGDSIYTATGFYTTNLTTIHGCDSIVTLDLLVHPVYAVSESGEICDGETYEVGDSVYTTTGVYTTTLTTIHGCDSIVTLDLLVHPVYDLSESGEICDGETYEVGGSIYTTTGVYTTTLTTIHSCDSIVTLDLLVHPIYALSESGVICDGETYEVGDSVYTTTGVYTTTLTTIHGCDSVVTLDLLVHPVYALSESGEMCEGETYEVGDSVYTTTGVYTTILSTIHGCDSIVTLDLLVHPVYALSESGEMCEGETYEVGDSVYTTTGVYTTTLSTIHGCDSIVTLDLLVHPIYALSESGEICDGEIYEVGDSVYTTTGVYTTTLTTIHGCDSIVTLDLLVHPVYTISESGEICEGETYEVGGSVYTETGIYTTTLTTIHGCDSIVTLDLLVHPVYDLAESGEICEGETYEVGDSVYTTTGVYTTTLSTIHGCDSIVIIDLLVHPEYTVSESGEICEGETYEVGGSVYTETGVYTTNLTTIHGCDSIVTLDLLVHPVYALSESGEMCEGETYEVGDSVYTETGVYTTNLTTIHGCDSIVTLNLLVHPEYEENISATICYGSTYEFGDSIITVSGNYVFNYYTVNGCDSLVNLDLMVNESYESTMEAIICEGATYEFGGTDISVSGEYEIVLISDDGCDSIIHLNLFVQPELEEFLEAVICEGDSYEFGGVEYISSGTYMQELSTWNGCDSLVHLNLSVNPMYESEAFLTVCSGGEVMIGGEYVSTPGTYSVSISSQWGCDSLMTYHLGVLPPVLSLVDLEICSGDSITVGGVFQNTGGVYVDTLQGTNGCDSIAIINLSVVEHIVAYATIETCTGDSVLINNIYQSEAGLYTDTTISAAGCDSITLTELILLQALVTEQEFDICPGEGVLVEGTYLTEPGLYFDTLLSSIGCDSILITVLEVGAAVELEQNLNICHGDSVMIGNELQWEAGTYIDTVQSTMGCDSIITIHLGLILPTVDNQEVSICSGDSIYAGGAYQTETGIYIDMLTASNGCDSILTTELVVDPPFEGQLEVSVCSGDSIYFSGDYISEAGTYTENLQTSAGCDSIVILTLEVVESLSENFELQICEGDSVLIGGVYESVSGVYENTYTSSGGCDSLVQTILTVVNTFETTLTEVICTGDSVLFGNEYYQEAGTYTLNLTSNSGCDSIVVLELQVLPVYENETNASICEGEIFVFGDNVFNSAGSYVFEYSSQYGCDSTVVLNLTLLPLSEGTETLYVCEGDSLLIYGEYQTNAGTYLETFQNQWGCDSMHSIELVVLPDYLEELVVQICEGDAVLVNGVYETEPGVYINNLTSTDGCDSIEIINLNVVEELIEYQVFELCEGDGIFAGGGYQTDPGVYYDTLSSMNGCDSIVVTQLEIQTVFVSVEEWVICNGDSVLLGDVYVTEPGIFTETLTTVSGCDSILYVTVDMLPGSYYNMQTQICAGDSLEIGNAVYKEAGTYIDTLSTYQGCDSIVVLELEVFPNDSLLLNETICAGDTYEFDGNLYTESGTYVANLQTQYGCDSTVILSLEVLDLLTDTTTAIICEGEIYEFAGEQLNTAGTYSHTFTTTGTCDSLAVLQLEVMPPSVYALTDTICAGGTYLFNGNELSETGTYTQVITNAIGCDSTTVLDLLVLDVLSANFEYSICEGDSIWLAGAYQKEAGVYTSSFTSSMGCDSIVTNELTVHAAVETVEEYLVCEGDSIYLVDGYYSVDTLLEVNYSNDLGCDSIVTLQLTVLPGIELLTEDYGICQGESVHLDVIGADEVNWSPADGLSCTDCPDPIATPDHTITYVVSAEGCQGEEVEAEVTVVVNYPPEILVTSIEEDESVVLGDSVMLWAVVNDQSAEISWTDSNGESYCTNCTSVNVEPYFGVTYTATAITDEGCVDEDEITFEINDGCSEGVLGIPNFITPNGDGHNDVFEIRYSNYLELSVLRVYNRWGELVFETNQIETDFWDGTFRGKTLNPDVYIYYMTGHCLNGDPFLEKGNVTIVK